MPSLGFCHWNFTSFFFAFSKAMWPTRVKLCRNVVWNVLYKVPHFDPIGQTAWPIGAQYLQDWYGKIYKTNSFVLIGQTAWVPGSSQVSDWSYFNKKISWNYLANGNQTLLKWNTCMEGPLKKSISFSSDSSPIGTKLSWDRLLDPLQLHFISASTNDVC